MERLQETNRLAPENCNKAMCKSCIFRQDGNQTKLPPGRLDEIKTYLLTDSSHVCHTTEKTCYGALEFQATIFHGLGIIPDGSVKSFLETAKKYLPVNK